MKFQLWTDSDHRSRRVIDSFPEQVLAESTLLSLDHVCQGFEWSIVRSQHWSAAPVVVEQSIHRVLKHSFLVTNDHLGGVQVEQFLQAVVAVDQTTVEVIQIAGRKIPTLQ